MKNLLIDSHLLIWMLFEPKRISNQAKKILSESNDVYVSLASIWELAIKHNKGRLVYSPKELLSGTDALEAKLLSIDSSHILALANIKSSHGDPFDRILLAQAKTENLLLVTADAQMVGLGLDYVVEAGS